MPLSLFSRLWHETPSSHLFKSVDVVRHGRRRMGRGLSAGAGVCGEMTLLYRSPNVVIDKHEWHVTVNQCTNGKRVTIYRFRPIGANVMWQHIAKWPYARRPKGLSEFFAPYRKSISVAMGEKQHARQARHEQLRVA